MEKKYKIEVINKPSSEELKELLNRTHNIRLKRNGVYVSPKGTVFVVKNFDSIFMTYYQNGFGMKRLEYQDKETVRKKLEKYTLIGYVGVHYKEIVT